MPAAYPQHALDVGVDARKALRRVGQLALDLLAADEQRLEVGPRALDLGEQLQRAGWVGPVQGMVSLCKAASASHSRTARASAP